MMVTLLRFFVHNTRRYGYILMGKKVQKDYLVQAGRITPIGLRGKKICMVVYLPSPTLLPPMYNSGISLTKLGAEIESVCWSVDKTLPLREVLRDGFVIRRFMFRSMQVFARLFGNSPANRFHAGIQYFFTYFEFVVKSFALAFNSKADIYEAHDLPTLLPTFLAAKLRQKPLVYRAHELYPEITAKLRFAALWKWIERRFVPKVQLVVTPEKNRSEIYLREYGATSQPLTIMNCPPFIDRIQSTRIRDALSKTDAKFKIIVLYQGLLDDSRCIGELIEASDSFLPNVGLVLMGSGFKEWKNPQEVIGARKNIVALPRVQYDQLSEYTASADIGILFYRNDCRNNYYCAPNKIHEYMMMGLPVVTVDYPGIKDLVERENIGICVNPENPFEIAKAVNRLATDRQLYDTLSANCIEASRRQYNWEKEFPKLLAAYIEILVETNGQYRKRLIGS